MGKTRNQIVVRETDNTQKKLSFDSIISMSEVTMQRRSIPSNYSKVDRTDSILLFLGQMPRSGDP